MSLASAFAPAENAYKNRVMADTWGHLAPSPRKKYRGSILFTHTEFGDILPIRVNFENLPESPWLADHVGGFIAEKAEEPGTIYRFTGTYMMFLNGSPSFSGKVEVVHI